jgi:pyrimidine operon attenuation protein/uracil phosphoribosyltransferase
MDQPGMERAFIRIAHEILERNKTATDLVVIGIKESGIFMARRLAQYIGKVEQVDVPVGEMDTTLYRDDVSNLHQGPIIHKTEIPCSIAGKKVVLVDDVLHTGRTIRAALDSLMQMGRPKLVQLAVLIDRGNRELPIHPDYVGIVIPTVTVEHVKVMYQEEEGEDRVVILEDACDDEGD